MPRIGDWFPQLARRNPTACRCEPAALAHHRPAGGATSRVRCATLPVVPSPAWCWRRWCRRAEAFHQDIVLDGAGRSPCCAAAGVLLSAGDRPRSAPRRRLRTARRQHSALVHWMKRRRGRQLIRLHRVGQWPLYWRRCRSAKRGGARAFSSACWRCHHHGGGGRRHVMTRLSTRTGCFNARSLTRTLDLAEARWQSLVPDGILIASQARVVYREQRHQARAHWTRTRYRAPRRQDCSAAPAPDTEPRVRRPAAVGGTSSASYTSAGCAAGR